MTDGLDITKELLGQDKSDFLKNVMKYGGYLEKVFSAGNAVMGVIKFIANHGESDMSKVIKKLGEISQELNKIETTIQQGFNEVIEHMDFVQLREEVTAPLQVRFDLYTRCYAVRGTIPLEEFKAKCKEETPRQLFSKMFEFLQTKSNIIATHLKTKNYAYSVLDEWSNALFHYATKLIILDMYYYGIHCKEQVNSGSKEPNEQDEITRLINEVKRMHERLKVIETDRMTKFHTGGFGKEKLREVFNSVAYNTVKYGSYDPNEGLSQIAYQMKQKWTKINGPADFYIMAVAGEHKEESERRRNDYAGWVVGEPDKVSVLENVGNMSEKGPPLRINVILIQPLSKAMKEHNEAARKQPDQFNGFTEKAEKADTNTEKSLSSESYSNAPTLILYNKIYVENSYSPGSLHNAPIHYAMIGEVWRSPGGPLPVKYIWERNVTSVIGINRVDMRTCSQAQLVFK